MKAPSSSGNPTAADVRVLCDFLVQALLRGASALRRSRIQTRDGKLNCRPQQCIFFMYLTPSAVTGLTVIYNSVTQTMDYNEFVGKLKRSADLAIIIRYSALVFDVLTCLNDTTVTTTQLLTSVCGVYCCRDFILSVLGPNGDGTAPVGRRKVCNGFSRCFAVALGGACLSRSWFATPSPLCCVCHITHSVSRRTILFVCSRSCTTSSTARTSSTFAVGNSSTACRTSCPPGRSSRTSRTSD